MRAATPIATVLMNTGVFVRQYPKTIHVTMMTAKMAPTVLWIACGLQLLVSLIE